MPTSVRSTDPRGPGASVVATPADPDPASHPGYRVGRMVCLAAAPVALFTTVLGTTIAQLDVAALEHAVRSWQAWWSNWSYWTVGLATVSTGAMAGVWALASQARPPALPAPDEVVDVEVVEVPRTVMAAGDNVISLDDARRRREAARRVAPG